jgi:hypothetical protein
VPAPGKPPGPVARAELSARGLGARPAIGRMPCAGRDTAPCRTRGSRRGPIAGGLAASMPASARPPEAEWHIAGMQARPSASAGAVPAVQVGYGERNVASSVRVSWEGTPGHGGRSCWHPEHRTSLPQPTRRDAAPPSSPTGSGRAPRHRAPAAPHRTEMGDQRAQATDRGQSPTCGCGADDR